MNNKRDAIERLGQEIQQLREKIELGDDSLPIELGFPKLLMGNQAQIRACPRPSYARRSGVQDNS